MKTEALKLALEALDNLMYWDNGKPDYDEARQAIAALREALAEQPAVQQEPVIDKSAAIRIATSLGWTPQRKPLTDEQIDAAIKASKKVDTGYAGWVRDQRREFARAIEAAHGIKENT